jgi:hypothetical protein
MNELIAIHPYKAGGLWVFDDPAVELRQEPFVSGADAIIDRLVQEIPNAESGFTLVFSAQPFPGYQAEFEWRREEFSGNWYYCPALKMEGWLCPALLKYFDAAPKKIYAQFRPKDTYGEKHSPDESISFYSSSSSSMTPSQPSFFRKGINPRAATGSAHYQPKKGR